jgi:hypothetical protein
MNIIGEIQKNQKEKIIVSTNEYKGNKYVDLRVHYEDETSGEYKPTKKGIAINPKILPEVVEMKYLYDSFKRISDELSKSDKSKSNKFKKPISKEDKDNIIKEINRPKKFNELSLKQIKNYLINEPDLTDEERFELYYDEHRRLQKEKEYKNSHSLDKMLKDLKIGKAKNNDKNKR